MFPKAGKTRKPTTQKAALCCLAVFSATIPFAPTLQSQSLDPIQQPAVGIRVTRPQLGDELGSGFVISVDNETLYLLTARHLFYSGKDSFYDHIQVTFALDPLREYPAEWFTDFANLDLATLKVSIAKLPPSLATRLKDLPSVKIRPTNEPLKLTEDIFLLGGKFQEWQLPKDSLSGLQDGNDRFDRFRFTGTGVHDGFSGAAILDSAKRLIGVHLGAVPSDDNYGRAQRITDAIPILSGNQIPMSKLDPIITAATQAPPHSVGSKTSRSAGEVKINRTDGLNYVWIAPGSFQMGCSPKDDACLEDEKPAHQVTISKGFWLGQTAVTQAAYKQVMKEDPSGFKGPDLPVETITWDEAKSYCSAVGGRLPTEAEWEYAARAGTAASRYGAINDIAWYTDNSGRKTHPVATIQPNSWNLYDMLGNVWQWTVDWYDDNYYGRGNMTDPSGPRTGTLRTLRGGGCREISLVVRVSRRGWNSPGSRENDAGVRCAAESLP